MSCEEKMPSSLVEGSSTSTIRFVVRNGWELLAVIFGAQANDERAIELLEADGVAIGKPVKVMASARLDVREPMAIMPCSLVSGFTARLIYGDPSRSVSRIHGRPQLCERGGVVHLRELLPADEPRAYPGKCGSSRQGVASYAGT